MRYDVCVFTLLLGGLVVLPCNAFCFFVPEFCEKIIYDIAEYARLLGN